MIWLNLYVLYVDMFMKEMQLQNNVQYVKLGLTSSLNKQVK